MAKYSKAEVRKKLKGAKVKVTVRTDNCFGEPMAHVYLTVVGAYNKEGTDYPPTLLRMEGQATKRTQTDPSEYRGILSLGPVLREAYAFHSEARVNFSWGPPALYEDPQWIEAVCQVLRDVVNDRNLKYRYTCEASQLMAALEQLGAVIEPVTYDDADHYSWVKGRGAVFFPNS